TELKKELSRDAVDQSPARGAPRMRDAHWVKPRLVAQVRFTEWTSDGKLRHPAFQGLRADKLPQECVREVASKAKTNAKANTKSMSPSKAISPSKSLSISLSLSNPDRLLYPKDRITKQDVADYYAAVSGPLLRALAERPLAVVHWNQGIDTSRWFHQNTAD